jgi:AcrR family transcriptional regulator
MSSNDSIGDHSGQVEPSIRRAYTEAGDPVVVSSCSTTCKATEDLHSLDLLTHPPDCTIWYMSEKSAKDLLLDHVVDHFITDGLGDLSLRKVAVAIGTSHRMLLYHFGSKNGLLLEVVRAVEARTRGQLGEVGQGAGLQTETDQVIREMWQFVADPAQGDFERLFFALYGRALQGDEQVRPLLGESIESWLEANDALAAARGVPRDLARVHARLGLAVVRGLLLDLLATGDRPGVDASLEVFARRYAGSWWEAETSPDGPDSPTSPDSTVTSRAS